MTHSMEFSHSFVAAGDHRVIPRVDVVFLSYNPTKVNPSISLDNVCTISLYELKKHRLDKKKHKYEMGINAYKHYKWYNTVLSNQLRRDGGPMLLRTFQWYIETSSLDAFKVDGVLYEAVSLIFESDVEHWYYARPGRRNSGSRVRLRNNKWEHDFGEQAKARIADCLVPPDGVVGELTVQQQQHRLTPKRKVCPVPRQSLGSISEE